MTAEKQLIVVVEGTAAMGPFWKIILSDHLEKLIRNFCNTELAGQKASLSNFELSLVMFNARGPCSACLVQRTGWTRNINTFFLWLSSITFCGGGFGDAAIAEGLAEALKMLSPSPVGSPAQMNLDVQKHCILIAASNPYPLPTPVYRPKIQAIEPSENGESQMRNLLSHAEDVAKSLSQCSVSLSVICPRQLPKLRSIFNAGKCVTRGADMPADNTKYPNFLILISESFIEACSSPNKPGIANTASSPIPVKMDVSSVPAVAGPPPNLSPSANGSTTNTPPISVVNMTPATVKIEPASHTPPLSSFSHLSSVSRAAVSGMPNMHTPSPISQEATSVGENMQEMKPAVSSMAQPLRSVGPATANVSILNNLSQARQVMNSAALSAGTSIGIQSIGVAPMAMHMSNMISSGTSSSVPTAQAVFSSTQSGLPCITATSTLMSATLPVQNSTFGSFSSTSSSMVESANISNTQAVGNLQAVIGLNQLSSGITQGNISGAQVENGTSTSQSIVGAHDPSAVSSGSGTMILAQSITQQVQAGLQPMGVTGSSVASMPSAQQVPTTMQSAQSKYVKVWEGHLSGQRQGQSVFITKMEGYRCASSSETLASNWPPTMQIVRLIAQNYMSDKKYVGKADYLVFRALNQHNFLAQLQEKKLCAVIQLPSQTLLLSVSDKAFRLIGMLFPGDMVVFKPHVPSQPSQQLQQQLPQIQQSLQQLQQTAQPMMGAGMGQIYAQGPARPQLVSQAQASSQASSQSQSNISGSNFLTQ